MGLDAQISYKAELGDWIIAHHRAMGVVISSKAIIGNHVTFLHRVTIGVNESRSAEKQRIIIGDNCYLSTGCVIISCELGDNCKVAPNAVVYNDVPSGMLCYANNERKKLLKNKDKQRKNGVCKGKPGI